MTESAVPSVRDPSTALAKILIVDDEKALRISLQKILERLGYYVEGAQDYPSAKKILSEMSFDLILIDIILPKITGIEIIRRLQEESQIRPAVIFITGEPNLETALQAIKLGAYDYLEKPVLKENLIQSIQQALTRMTQYRNYIKSKEPGAIIQSEAPPLPKLSEVPLKSYSTSIEEIWTALAELKKKYRDSFNDDQRNILNIIVKNITSMRETVKKE